MKHIFPLILMLSILSCESKKSVLEKETYDGPSVAMDSIDVLISDSAITKLRLVAPRQMVYENEDRDFPNGIYLEFYNDVGILSSTLRANSGYYFAEEDYYKAEGDVQMHGIAKGDELHTELLNWVPKEERIHTDKFVTIKSDGELLKGEGLEASEDFDEYTILNPTGVMNISPNKKKNEDESGFDEDLVFEEDTTVYENEIEE
ncbi:LPS export ABC transporter periplasmic protein LptC [Reichenbachiella agarivorans]|uniref:LPS export ABC transporter periplasmic protein LptC n=1 Tax=Reichenbachiella agarivorans TaxID=2979464 RepID=A0ABY6CRX7_9BACT|nr:LPS export ABC transporter periplasmic protein LptC [Reichenbachiella agarivorans]UXP33281.1 LPS export ABC transporter periplasmic protein LptC [Reichenbachiella agarivorans]